MDHHRPRGLHRCPEQQLLAGQAPQTHLHGTVALTARTQTHRYTDMQSDRQDTHRLSYSLTRIQHTGRQRSTTGGRDCVSKAETEGCQCPVPTPPQARDPSGSEQVPWGWTWLTDGCEKCGSSFCPCRAQGCSWNFGHHPKCVTPILYVWPGSALSWGPHHRPLSFRGDHSPLVPRLVPHMGVGMGFLFSLAFLPKTSYSNQYIASDSIFSKEKKRSIPEENFSLAD